MFLPPFYGIPNKYDEPAIKKAVISYLASDIATSLIPTPIGNVTYLQSDVCVLENISNLANSTFLAVDVLVFDSAGGDPSIPTDGESGGDTGSGDTGSGDIGDGDNGNGSFPPPTTSPFW